MTTYLKPPALKSGDKVGIVAPSFPCAAWFPRRFETGLAGLRSGLGVEPVVAGHVHKAHAYESGTVEERAAELQAFLASPSIGAVFTTLGGFNSNELLPYLDLQALRNKPKIFVGYSDTTILQLALTSLCGWITFSGPAVMPQFGEHPAPLPFMLDNLKAILMRDCVSYELPDARESTHEFIDWASEDWQSRARTMQANPGREVWRVGEAQAPLFGGNIETLNFLVGTPWVKWPQEFILFLEATEAEATLPRIQRAIVHLRQCGVLDRVRGLLFGQCPDAHPMAGRTLRQTVMQLLADYRFPVVGEMSFGHVDPILTLPNGCMAYIKADATEARVTLLESAVTVQ